MPYRNLPYVIVLAFALAVLAFWPGYFSRLGTSSWLFHLHGITASLWMLAVGFQAWSINNKQRDLHRAGGLATLAMFPLFMAGAGGVTYTMAKATEAGDPFYLLWGAKLGIIDFISAIAILWLVHLALVQRRNLLMHANAMVATLLFLTVPLFPRLLNAHMPGLKINGPADFPIFGAGLQWAQLMGFALALWLARRAGRNRLPFVVVAAVIALQSLLFETFATGRIWTALHLWAASVPVALMLGSHALLGALVVWHGWQAGARKRRTVAGSASE
ncbi:hypothetical protein [Sandaracinobacteroides hominis]|uniref:hypothetical protein n=1 Tax=Sandaracinobacteroides hominis TaxID=2780086 RepID=UPI0018F366CA|nr:hypothetical protein [Sandaracinobacteroides hominis]